MTLPIFAAPLPPGSWLGESAPDSGWIKAGIYESRRKPWDDGKGVWLPAAEAEKLAEVMARRREKRRPK